MEMPTTPICRIFSVLKAVGQGWILTTPEGGESFTLRFYPNNLFIIDFFRQASGTEDLL
jgi:hypothetical protein